MAKEILNEETGEKETFYTKEEMDAKDSALSAKEAEIAEAKKVAEERGKNFNGVNEKIGKLEEEVKSTKQLLEEKTVREKESAKSTYGMKFYGTNAELKITLENKYAILSGMPESTPEEIQARMTEAAKLAGISVGSQNPLYTPSYGEPPQQKQAQAKEEEFMKSDRGVAAQKAMGLEPEAKK